MTADSLETLITPDTTIRVSSTLDKTVGKKHLIDNNPETCWTSQQGLPQYVLITFTQRVIPKRIVLTFQGGFVGIQSSLYIEPEIDGMKDWQKWASVYPEDVNRRQSFSLPPLPRNAGIGSLKLVFEQSSDFFGRITLYDLTLEGTVISNPQRPTENA